MSEHKSVDVSPRSPRPPSQQQQQEGAQLARPEDGRATPPSPGAVAQRRARSSCNLFDAEYSAPASQSEPRARKHSRHRSIDCALATLIPDLSETIDTDFRNVHKYCNSASQCSVVILKTWALDIHMVHCG